MKWFWNLAASDGNRTWTGTRIGDKVAADVNIANSPSSPFPVLEDLDVLETRFHQGSVVNINGSAGAWVALGGGAALSNDIKQLQVTSTMGQPLEIGIGASAGAAQRKFILNRGDGPVLVKINLDDGEELWVRSLDAAVTSGELTINLLGAPA